MNKCVLCLEPIDDLGYTFDCGHHLHHKCFHKSFKYNYDIKNNYISCPMCSDKKSYYEYIIDFLRQMFKY